MHSGPGTGRRLMTASSVMPASNGNGKRDQPVSVALIALLVLLGIAGLPLAAWLDLRNLSEHMLQSQAQTLASAINSMRSFYSSNVVGRVRGFTGQTQVVHNYRDVPGAIPIPATLSIELGGVITGKNN